MNVHTSHLLPARCARPTDRSAASSASSAPERVSDLRRTCFESSTSALVCSTSILCSLYWHRGGGKREAAVFGNGSTLFNWRQTDCSKHLRDFKAVYIFFPFSSSFWNVTRFPSVNTQTSQCTCLFVPLFVSFCFMSVRVTPSLYENFTPTYAPVCAPACEHVCLLASVSSVTQCLRSSLLLAYVCACLCVCCVFATGVASPWPVFFFLSLFFYNQHVRCWKREALFSTFSNGTGYFLWREVSLKL